jgi:uncharacterized damage-inducible protein DinB
MKLINFAAKLHVKMKELLLQYGKYNIWANKKIIDVLLKLTEEQLDMKINSSFPTLRRTVYHMWSAEQIWLDRLQLAESPVWAESNFTGSFAEACANWQQASEQLVAFISKQFDGRGLEHVVQYFDRQKRPHKTPVYTILQQSFNHATYHRGQLVTMLRQAGVTKIPGTDMIVYSREKKA